MTEATREKVNNAIARKSNELIQKAKYDLSAHQQKIIIYLISQIKTTDTELKSTELDLREFCEMCEIDYSGGNDAQLKKELESLNDKVIAKAENGKWIHIADGIEVPIIKWIDKPKIISKSRKVILKLDSDLAPMLLQLPEYTRISLKYVLRLKSKYSIRLYEYLKSEYFGDKENIPNYIWEMSVDLLRERTGYEANAEYRDLKRRVLDVAVKEINESTDLNLEYKTKTEGRKVVGIIFTINKKPEEKQISKPKRKKSQDSISSQSGYDDLIKLSKEYGVNE